MDQELKQRIIGALVVTALAAIFIPMLFDDPIDGSGQAVTELTIPETPVAPVNPAMDKLPANPSQVLGGAQAEPSQKANGEEEQSYSEPVEAEIISEEASVEEPVIEEEAPAQLESPKTIPKTLSPEAKPELSKQTESKSATAIKKVVKEKLALPKAVPGNNAQAPAKVLPNAANIASTENKVVAPEKISSSKNPDSKVAETVKPSALLQRWYIRVGSYSKEENAISLWTSLRKQGFPAALETVVVDSKTLYRLKVGPELDQKRAMVMKEKLDKLNHTSSILMQE
ncbi:MAG: SPOR domain-containing protein [Methylococcaceae bacterium]|jgi:DedD protein